jgi:predicted RNA-binding Zn-ribbon protein involved in translation (DUF1610 family)
MSQIEEQGITAAGRDVGREPLMKKDEKNEYMIHYSCPACGKHLLASDGYRATGRKSNYCPDCGQRFEWSNIPGAWRL